MRVQSPKHFNWQQFLCRHPIFSSLSESGIASLLEEHVSEERSYKSGEIIIRQDEPGDKAFLIGLGTAKAVLQSDRDQNGINLVTLNRGELFGEMALLEDKPRSATVKANEDCALLAINGDDFHKIIQDYPEIEFKVLSNLSRRIRQVNDKILAIQQIDIDAKLDLFNSKLNAELKVFDAALHSAQALFDQTNARTNEIITSAERSQAHRNIFYTAIGTVATLVGILLGWFGFSEYKQIGELASQANNNVEYIKESKDVVEQARGLAENARPTIDKLVLNLRRQCIFQFGQALNDPKELGKAIEAYQIFNEIGGETMRLLDELEVKISDPPYQDYTILLLDILETPQSFEHKSRAYYLLLANAILANRTTFNDGSDIDDILSDYKKYVRGAKDQKTEIPDLLIASTFADIKNQEKLELFEQVKSVVDIRSY